LIKSWRLAGHRARSGGVIRLEEIPLVAVEVFEDGDGGVGFLARLFEEFYVGSLHEAIVPPEIVGVKKEEYAIAGLLADLLELLGRIRLGEEQACAPRAGGSNDDPAFAGGKGSVFDETETEGIGEKGQGFVIIANEQGYMGK
jgi:hypothetical protein